MDYYFKKILSIFDIHLHFLFGKYNIYNQNHFGNLSKIFKTVK